jgi:hypothetical protein
MIQSISPFDHMFFESINIKSTDVRHIYLLRSDHFLTYYDAIHIDNR